MVRVYKEVDVEFDLDDIDTDDLIDELHSRNAFSLSDFDDDEIIEELNRRGHSVTNILSENLDFQNAIDYYKRCNISEAMIYLERAIPELYGLGAKLK